MTETRGYLQIPQRNPVAAPTYLHFSGHQLTALRAVAWKGTEQQATSMKERSRHAKACSFRPDPFHRSFVMKK